MKRLSVAQILRQLRLDLEGKDSYRGVTLSYAWLANQSGHFMLGFVPTCFLALWFKCYWFTSGGIYAGFAIAGLWFLFECWNVIKSIWFEKPVGGFVFKPDWGNVIYDTLTDVVVFAIGAFAATIVYNRCHHLGMWALLLLAFFLVSAAYWYPTKIFQQQAGFPFQFRLSQWSTPLDDATKATIQDYATLCTKEKGHHLLITGALKTGKTSLSVGIGNELSIQHKAVSYVTATKLFSLFYENDAPATKDILWGWRKADLLIIDDINPGLPFGENNVLITPQQFLWFLENSMWGAANKQAIRETNVIWVLGNSTNTAIQVPAWQQMLIDIGVEANSISVVKLDS